MTPKAMYSVQKSRSFGGVKHDFIPAEANGHAVAENGQKTPENGRKTPTTETGRKTPELGRRTPNLGSLRDVFIHIQVKHIQKEA